MLRLFSMTAVILIAAHAALAQDSAFPSADAFAPGAGRTWFSDCNFEAERYVTCKNAAPDAIAAISTPGDMTPGAALQTFISDIFIEKGCAFEAGPETFRVNGIFLSFDTKSAKDIRCKGKKSALTFAPEGMAFLDTLYFFTGDPPQ